MLEFQKVAGAVTALFLAAFPAEAAPIYRENFSFCGSEASDADPAQELTGWSAFRTRSVVGKLGTLKVSPPGSPVTSMAINSLPSGTSDGCAFWSKATPGLTVFTDEFSVQAKNLAVVEYEQRLGGIDLTTKETDATRLAVLVGSQWYISDIGIAQADAGTWELVSWNIKAITFGTSRFSPGRGPDRPSNSGVPFPTEGDVVAFGVFIDQVRGKVRFDNFTLFDFQLNGPAPQAQAACGAQPLETPVPGGPNVTPTPGPSPGSQWCPAAPKPFGRAKVSRKTANLIIAAISKRSVIGKRNRALSALALLQNIPIDDLINRSRSDFLARNSSSYLVVAGKEVTLIPKVATLLDQYVSSLVFSLRSNLPLFERQQKIQATLPAAACGDEIVRVIRSTARKIGVSSKVRFVR